MTALIDARGALDDAAVKARLHAELALQAARGVSYWPLFLEPSGDFVGAAGLRPKDGGELLELGFHLVAEAWGKGLATEAAIAVARFAFRELGEAALFAGHNPNNQASARVLAKLGFERTHDELYAPTGLLHPSCRLERARFEAIERARDLGK